MFVPSHFHTTALSGREARNNKPAWILHDIKKTMCSDVKPFGKVKVTMLA